MTTTTPMQKSSGRRKSALDHATAMRLAATEYDRFVAQLRQLATGDWDAATSCPAWDVHAMACHVLGMAKMSASLRENMRQFRAATRAAKREGVLFIDALTDLQVREHASLSPGEVVDALDAVGPKAARGRKRTPALMRRIPVGDQPVDETGAMTEQWSLGYLNDVILTRDTWMHRSDIAAATGRDVELSAEHDGVLIADIAAEWAGRHGQPCTLVLTGPAGGRWSWGAGGPTVERDAVEFCRVISGRAAGEGLLTTRVPF